MSTFFIILLSIGVTWFVTNVFRRGVALNKMVIAFGKIHLMSKELTSKIGSIIDQDEFKEELFAAAHLFRREIIFHLDQHKWSMNTPLLIPGISNERIVLGIIFEQTINRLLFLGKEIGYEAAVQEITKGKEAYLNDNSANEDLNEFIDTFTQEQKATVAVALVTVSKSSRKVRDKEIELIGQASRILGIIPSDPTFIRISGLDANSIIQILKTLTEDQRRWFVLSIHSIVVASGGNDDKFNCGLGICEKIGIEEDQYIEITKKSAALMKAFKLG